jgi:hypothetical protein
LSWGDWMHHSELHGSGVRTADWDPPSGANLSAPSKSVREDLADTLGDLSADAAVVPPPGYKLRLLEAVAKTWEMFPGAITAAAQELVIAITGQSSSTEITRGQDTASKASPAPRNPKSSSTYCSSSARAVTRWERWVSRWLLQRAPPHGPLRPRLRRLHPPPPRQHPTRPLRLCPSPLQRKRPPSLQSQRYRRCPLHLRRRRRAMRDAAMGATPAPVIRVELLSR